MIAPFGAKSQKRKTCEGAARIAACRLGQALRPPAHPPPASPTCPNPTPTPAPAPASNNPSRSVSHSSVSAFINGAENVNDPTFSPAPPPRSPAARPRAGENTPAALPDPHPRNKRIRALGKNPRQLAVTRLLKQQGTGGSGLQRPHIRLRPDRAIERHSGPPIKRSTLIARGPRSKSPHSAARPAWPTAPATAAARAARPDEDCPQTAHRCPVRMRWTHRANPASSIKHGRPGTANHSAGSASTPGSSVRTASQNGKTWRSRARADSNQWPGQQSGRERTTDSLVLPCSSATADQVRPPSARELGRRTVPAQTRDPQSDRHRSSPNVGHVPSRRPSAG